MAGARPKSFTPSVYKGSEEVVECPCTPCARVGTDIEAVNFCKDCSEFYCLGCTKVHIKLGMTASHNVVERSKADQAGRGKTAPAQLPTERCRDHHGELVTSYCRDHDAVVCNTCATMDHRSCDSLAYIPSISGDSNTRQAIPRVKANVSASLKATKAARLHVQEHQAMVDEEKTKQQTTIKANTDRLIAHARDLEKAALADVTRHHQEASAKISAELAQLDDTEAALERRQRNLDKAHTTCDSQVFVDAKLGIQEAQAARHIEQRLTSSSNVTSKFVVDGRVDVVLSDVSSLGKVVVNKPYKAVLKGKYDIKQLSKGDIISCNITDVCELPSGDILMTDFCHNCIKILDKTYNVTKRFNMPSRPYGICQTRPNEIAVTLTMDKKVQFVDVSVRWKMTTSFPVEDCCRGICYSRDELLMACGGHPGNEGYAPEGPGHVAIYSLSGSLWRRIKHDGHDRQIFSCPRAIVTSHDGNKIHVADEKNGVITVDRKGIILSVFNKNIQYARGLYVIDTVNLIVSGLKSNNVLQITTDGEPVSELLCNSDGIKAPWCVFCSRSESTLTVTFNDSNKIKVFDLKS